MPLDSNNKTEFSYDDKTVEIFKNVFVFFGILSPQGFVLNLDGKVFQRVPADPSLLVGQKFSETVYWQSTEHTSEQLEKAILEAAQGRSSKIRVEFRINAGEKIFVELCLQTLRDMENNIAQIFFCAQEVSAREKEIEFQKIRGEQMLLAAENAEIGLWFWDLVEDKIYATAKCGEFFEIAPHQKISFDSILEIVHPEDRSRVEAAFADARNSGKEYNVEYRVIYSDGNIHWLAVRGKAQFNASGKPQTMTGVVRKVTDKKIANEEFAKVYADEKKARDEAEEANRSKDFFLAVVSHELRSPLNTILGWTKILLTREIKEDVRRNALETIEKSARSQAKLIEDLIDSARVSSGKLRLELHSVNLFEILKTVYNSQKPLTEAKNVNLEFSSDKENITVFGDTIRLQQVFTNLVSNALKFTSAGGNIKISVQCEISEVKVMVKDDGQGISPESLPNIFKQFKQGDGKSSSDKSGLGLGLSIVRILTEKHNGQIQAESAGVGQGSVFTVILPLNNAKKGATIPETEGLDRQQGKRLDAIKILIVEDDSDSREVLQVFLEQSGAEVESAESAFEAMNLLRASARDLPDIIVSDLAMPNEDGYSLIGRIRKLPVESGGAIPAIALSAFASAGNKKQAFDGGFQKYHTKPFEPDIIIQDILTLVKG